MGKSKNFSIGRDADTDRLKSVKDAQPDPKGSVVERMPKPGHGTAK